MRLGFPTTCLLGNPASLFGSNVAVSDHLQSLDPRGTAPLSPWERSFFPSSSLSFLCLSISANLLSVLLCQTSVAGGLKLDNL